MWGSNPRFGCKGYVMINPTVRSDPNLRVNNDAKPVVLQNDVLSYLRLSRKQAFVNHPIQRLESARDMDQASRVKGPRKSPELLMKLRLDHGRSPLNCLSGGN